MVEWVTDSFVYCWRAHQTWACYRVWKNILRSKKQIHFLVVASRDMSRHVRCVAGLAPVTMIFCFAARLSGDLQRRERPERLGEIFVLTEDFGHLMMNWHGQRRQRLHGDTNEDGPKPMKYPMKYEIFGGMNIRRNPSYEQVTRGDEARFFFWPSSPRHPRLLAISCPCPPGEGRRGPAWRRFFWRLRYDGDITGIFQSDITKKW